MPPVSCMDWTKKEQYKIGLVFVDFERLTQMKIDDRKVWCSVETAIRRLLSR